MSLRPPLYCIAAIAAIGAGFDAGCARPIPPVTPGGPPPETTFSPVDERFAREPNTGPEFPPDRFIRCGHDWSPPGCMVRIPGAAFVLGAQKTDPNGANHDPLAAADEGPPHEVRVGGFWIHQQEVSAQHYRVCVEAGACRAEDAERGGGAFHYGVAKFELYPMNGVTWRGANDYCRWIGGRLPTEAEFEYAARGASYRTYPWGPQEPACPTTILSNGCGAGHAVLLPVGRTGPFEVYNLVGNVWEWMADYYDAKYYAASPRENPAGPAEGTRRVQRGGSWMSEDPTELRVSARASLGPDERLADLGFRCVRPAGTPR